MGQDPEKLLVTSDLHFGLYPAGDACTLDLAEHVRSSGADAFIISGDVADADTDYFAACLDLFTSFKGEKMLVPGNHDLWTAGIGSEKKYREVLPAIAADCGFRMLDAGPVVMGNVAIIGNIGWYDYSFRNPDLQVSLEQYREKRLPGVCTWNDSRFIDWELSDEEFTEKCLRKLQSAYRSVAPRVHTVVAVLHVLPFSGLLHGPSTAAYEFCRAYLGSERLGDLLLECPKVRYLFCGHRHAPAATRIRHVEAAVVGSEYMLKRLAELNLSTGQTITHTFVPAPAYQKETDLLPPEAP